MSQSNTTLHQPWLSIARAAWFVCAGVAITAFIASMGIALGEPLPHCTTLEAACGPWSLSQEDVVVAQKIGMSESLMRILYFGRSILTYGAFIVIGLIIFWRRSDDWLAWLLSLTLVSFAVEGVQNLGVFQIVVYVPYLIAAIGYYLLPFVFPTGHFEPRWTRWIFVPILVLSLVPQMIITTLGEKENPIASFGILVGGAVWFCAAIYSIIYRYARISNAIERQQTKWLMGSILAPILGLVPFTFTSTIYAPSQPSPERLAFMLLVVFPTGLASYLALALGIAIAILRYRLWDIDIIIRRTLIYSILTALLALFYIGAVVILQQFLRALTGAGDDLAIIVSTWAIAALFNPLRHRVQDTIDHRFYRRKYDAQQVLERFAATARDEVELEKLAGELLRVVTETMQPTSVNLWLKKVK